MPDLGAEALGAKAAAQLFWVAALLSLERLTYALGAHFERNSIPTDGRLARAKE